MTLLLSSLCVALSMYSAIPVPHVEWTKRNMRYALCFFPCVGLICAGLLLLLDGLYPVIHASPLLFGAVAALIPIAVTGGIHLDGFCDTTDALASHAPREKKLEIMKDPHIGAFGVMGCVLYLILSLAMFAQLPGSPALRVLAVGFVLSRALSGLSVVRFPCAKNSGLAALFAEAAERKRAGLLLKLIALLCAVSMLALHPVYGVVCLLAAAGAFIGHRILSVREFGGVTGDLCGYFLQLCELMMLTACMLIQGVFYG